MLSFARFPLEKPPLSDASSLCWVRRAFPGGAFCGLALPERRAAVLSGSRPRVSPVGDAYDWAASFGDECSNLLVIGASPFKTLGAFQTWHGKRAIKHAIYQRFVISTIDLGADERRC